MAESLERLPIENILAQAHKGFHDIAHQHKLVRWEEESQFALQAYRRNPGLQKCALYTIQDAIINVAAVGLSLNPAYGYAYLVPEYNKQTEQTECVLRVSFKGLIKVATDSGAIDWVAADVVKKNDFFRYNGRWALPDHTMENPFSQDRGESVGVYCVARMNDGQYLCDTAPWSEVMKAKAAAKTKTVWDQWEDEMAKKFMIKRASKQWPKTDQTERLNKAVAVINEYEGSDALIDRLGDTAARMLEHYYAEGGPEIDAIVELYDELTDDEKQTLYTAKSKGGWFEHKERQAIFKELIPTWRREQRALTNQPEQPEENKEWLDAYEGEKE
jgi:recombination protein RecT